MQTITRRFRKPFFLMNLTLALAAGAVTDRALAQQASGTDAADPHAAHRHMLQTNSDVRRSVANYAVPHLNLVRDDDARVFLDAELNDGKPVVVSFIFTTCTTICPMTSQILSMLQDKLGEDRSNVHLVSISIDPEQDTPARLREYATRFGAGPEWRHYTGTLRASIEAQQAFDVYRGDKSNHSPVTLVRPVGGGPWVRLEGFATPEALLLELQKRETASR